jgi:hypothetical protein
MTERFRVIRKSNYDHDDWRGDELFATPYCFSQSTATTICDAMNNDQYRNNNDWFVVVRHDYVLPKPWGP